MLLDNEDDFDLCLRLVKDNKINSRNSWEVALIDYFHDLSILREGDQINFQKASATLDGCVKIYSSRVDSIVTETGRLLSGLSSKDAEETKNVTESDQDPENAHESEKRMRNNRYRSNVNTLVDFKSLKYRELDSELAIDPVFKKALSDFDEGGSKSLLFNLLKVDDQCRVVFDAKGSEEKFIRDTESKRPDDAEIDVSNGDKYAGTGSTIYIDENVRSLGKHFQLSQLDDTLELCPSLEQVENLLNGVTSDLQDLKEKTERSLHNESAQQDSTGHEMAQGSFFDFALGDDDDYNDSEQESVFTKNKVILEEDEDEEEEEDFKEIEAELTKSSMGVDYDALDNFCAKLTKNWTGPDNWKVIQLKNKYEGKNHNESASKPEALYGMSKKPKKKNDFVIDFLSVSNESSKNQREFENQIFGDLFDQDKKSAKSLDLPKKQQFVESHNCLPDDRQFNITRFTTLFTKKEQIKSKFFTKRSLNDNTDKKNIDDNANDSIVADADFWADNYDDHDDFDMGVPDNSNRQFSNNHGSSHLLDDVPSLRPPDSAGNDNPLFGTDPQHNAFMVPSLRSNNTNDQLQYAKKAKVVDVKLLKDTLWEKIESQKEAKDLKLSDIVKTFDSKQTQISEATCSYYFICLLHLANEKKFTISDQKDLMDLTLDTTNLT